MKTDLRTLETVAAKGRLLGLDMVYHCASGHLGGSFSAMDILTVLYFDVMKVDPQNPTNPDRDRFVLSKGHCTPALYPILAQRGYFPEEDLNLFRSIDGHLSGHAEMHHVKGVDMSTGSLGQGISAAVGMALAGKMDRKDYRVYAVLGDGEVEEGQVWEAFMSAAKYQLDNLCAVIDVNGPADRRQDRRRDAHRAPGPEAGGLWLARHPRGRPRLCRPGGCLRPGRPGEGQAHHAPGQDGEGQGGLLHGEPGRLARQGPQRGTV